MENGVRPLRSRSFVERLAARDAAPHAAAPIFGQAQRADDAVEHSGVADPHLERAGAGGLRRFERKREDFGVGGLDVAPPKTFEAGLQQFAFGAGAGAKHRSEIAVIASRPRSPARRDGRGRRESYNPAAGTAPRRRGRWSEKPATDVLAGHVEKRRRSAASTAARRAESRRSRKTSARARRRRGARAFGAGQGRRQRSSQWPPFSNKTRGPAQRISPPRVNALEGFGLSWPRSMRLWRVSGLEGGSGAVSGSRLESDPSFRVAGAFAAGARPGSRTPPKTSRAKRSIRSRRRLAEIDDELKLDNALRQPSSRNCAPRAEPLGGAIAGRHRRPQRPGSKPRASVWRS